jgi:hypothetical protein
MATASTTLILSGIGCLGAFGLLTYRLRRNAEGFLNRTEGRAMTVALALVVTAILGVALIVRGLLG